MSNKNISDHLAEFTELGKMYVSTQIKWMKLDLLERSSKAGAFMLRSVILLVVVAIGLLFLTFAFSFWYGQTYNDYVTGFLISAAFHAVLAVIIVLFRKIIVDAPVIRTFAKIIFNEEDED